MAKAGAQGTGRVGLVPRKRVKNPANGLWTWRDTSTARFASAQACTSPRPRLLVEDRRWRRLPGRRLVRAEVGGHTTKRVAWWRWLLRAGGR